MAERLSNTNIESEPMARSIGGDLAVENAMNVHASYPQADTEVRRLGLIRAGRREGVQRLAFVVRGLIRESGS